MSIFKRKPTDLDFFKGKAPNKIESIETNDDTDLPSQEEEHINQTNYQMPNYQIPKLSKLPILPLEKVAILPLEKVATIEAEPEKIDFPIEQKKETPAQASTDSDLPIQMLEIEKKLNGELIIDHQHENIDSYIEKSTTIKGGHLNYESGVQVNGTIKSATITVSGTLIIDRNACLEDVTITCDRLYNFGQLHAATIVCKGLLVGWSGSIKATNGIYHVALEKTKQCKITGNLMEFKESSC